jgi:hypothetical protein
LLHDGVELHRPRLGAAVDDLDRRDAVAVVGDRHLVLERVECLELIAACVEPVAPRVLHAERSEIRIVLGLVEVVERVGNDRGDARRGVAVRGGDHPLGQRDFGLSRQMALGDLAP